MIGLTDFRQVPAGTEGTIARIDGNEVTIETDDGEVVFAWIDDSIGAHLAVSELVQVEAGSVGGQLRLSTVRASSTTLVTIDGYTYTRLSTEPGAERELAPARLPTLRYRLADCCGEGSRMFSCDYSLLTAAVGDEQVEIPFGQVETVGGWSVGNWGSSFRVYGEETWAVRATFVGPPQD